nr:hypothetical protein [Tanacetum cinerariifolium]
MVYLTTQDDDDVDGDGDGEGDGGGEGDQVGPELEMAHPPHPSRGPPQTCPRLINPLGRNRSFMNHPRKDRSPYSTLVHIRSKL